MSRETALLLATPPTGTDKTLWLYELCRFLTAQCNSLIVGFLFDTPPCSATTCPEMRASEWQFLCAVHDAPKSCCAIDYCCHTLDWAANVVTNANIFPSRFVVDAHDKNTALKNLVNVFRRLHRIFAHAWFQHRGVFWSVEGQSGLYVFFKTVCDVYDLLSAENYKLPPEAEGLEATPAPAADTAGDKKSSPFSQPPAIAKRETNGRPAGEAEEFSPPSRTNTRRHIKSSPSTGSAVTTVLEADEDDGTGLSGKLRGLRGSAPSTVDEEADAAAAAAMPVLAEHAFVDQPPLRPSSVIPRGSEPESWRSRMLLEPEEPESQPTEDLGEPGPVVTAESSNLVAELHMAAAEPVEEAPEVPEQGQTESVEVEKDEGEKEEEKGEAETEEKEEKEEGENKEEEGKKREEEEEEELEEEQGNETILPTAAAEETAEAETEAEGTSAEAEGDVEPKAPAAEEPSSEPTAEDGVEEEAAPSDTSETVPEKEAAPEEPETEEKSAEESKSE